MRFHIFRNAVIKKISVKCGLQIICFWFLISLMTETRKHTLSYASELSGTGKSAFSKFLYNNKDVIKYTLNDLSKKQAKKYSKVIKRHKSLPWKILIVIDSTPQKRSSLKSENVQKFNNGHGYVIGHQRTNIILFFNEKIIPMPPIPFYTKKYCKKNNIDYISGHEKIVEYLKALNLNEYICSHKNSGVVVLTDSGYDDKKIQNTVKEKKWHFITALKSHRGVKSEAEYAKTGKSGNWNGIAVFFRNHRKIAWETVKILTGGPKKKREDFRIRHTEVFLKNVGKIRAVCSEFRKKRGGCRKYTACSDLRALPVQILTAYRLRWKIETFHKDIKMHLGFEHTSAKYFSSVESHIYLVYCAYILINADLPGVRTKGTISEKQKDVADILKNKKNTCIIRELTKIGGAERYKNELKSALTA